MKTHEVNDVLFKFKCLNCDNEEKINICEILEIGHPICCDEEMEIDDRCIIQ